MSAPTRQCAYCGRGFMPSGIGSTGNLCQDCQRISRACLLVNGKNLHLRKQAFLSWVEREIADCDDREKALDALIGTGVLWTESDGARCPNCGVILVITKTGKFFSGIKTRLGSCRNGSCRVARDGIDIPSFEVEGKPFEY